MRKTLSILMLMTGLFTLAAWNLASFWGYGNRQVVDHPWAYAAAVYGTLFLGEALVLKLLGLTQEVFPWASWVPFLVLHPLGRFLSGTTFPAPHDFLERKLQVATGLVGVAHLFLFAILALAALHRHRVQRPVRALTLLAIFLFSGLLVVTRHCDVTGDEPHYLLMAHSVMHDLDLDLANNYANGDAGFFYQRGVLEPQGLEHEIRGRRYSHHPLGPVILILPGYILGGRLGAALVMALLAAWTLGLTMRILKEGGAGNDTLMATGAVGLLGSPLLLFSGLVFPEIPTALLLALFLQARLSRRDAAMGLAAGALLWFHNRNVLILIPLVLVYAWSNRARPNRLLRFALGLALPLGLLAIYFRSIYGVWTPLGAHNEPFTSLFRPGRFFIGLFGLLFDQEAGFWFHYLVFAAVPAGILLLLKSRDPLRLYLVATTMFYYLFMSFYENLGQTPAARFLVGLTPFLLLLLAPVFEAARRRPGWARFLGVLAAAGVAVNAVLAAVPWLRYNRLEGENWMLKIAGNFLDIPWTRWEPSFHLDPVPVRSYLLSIFWCAVVGVLTYRFLRTANEPRRLPDAKAWVRGRNRNRSAKR